MRDASTARTLRRTHLTFQDLVSAAADVSEGEVGVIVQSMFQRGLIRFARPQPTFLDVPRPRARGVARKAPPRRREGRFWT
jgi:hypothetical protein